MPKSKKPSLPTPPKTLKISGSRFGKWKQCELSQMGKFLLPQDGMAPPPMNPSQMGNLIHAVLAEVLSKWQGKVPHITKSDLHKAMMVRWDKKIQKQVDDINAGKVIQHPWGQTQKDLIWQCLLSYWGAYLAPSVLFRVENVEGIGLKGGAKTIPSPGNAHQGVPFQFTGKWDLISTDIQTNERILTEFKSLTSSGTIKSQIESFEKGALPQLSCYGLILQDIFGSQVDKIRLIVITPKGVVEKNWDAREFIESSKETVLGAQSYIEKHELFYAKGVTDHLSYAKGAFCDRCEMHKRNHCPAFNGQIPSPDAFDEKKIKTAQKEITEARQEFRYKQAELFQL